MLLPTKGIDVDRALLSVGGTLISLLETPTTVSGLWERFRQHARRTGRHSRVAFDWFALRIAPPLQTALLREPRPGPHRSERRRNHHAPLHLLFHHPSFRH